MLGIRALPSSYWLGSALVCMEQLPRDLPAVYYPRTVLIRSRFLRNLGKGEYTHCSEKNRDRHTAVGNI